MTTRVRCSICGLMIDSTTVAKEYYKLGEHIDTGCPYCGHEIPLLATEAKLKKRTPIGKKEPFTVGEEPVNEP